MSLSARIAVGPSRHVALLTIAVMTGGFVVAGVTAAARLPEGVAIVFAAAASGWALAIASIVRGHRATSQVVLSVSDRAEIGVAGLSDEHPWRLVEPTMAWSGFSVIALAEGDASPRWAILRYPLFDADVAPTDRRALSRFLRWSLRGGGAFTHS